MRRLLSILFVISVARILFSCEKNSATEDLLSLKIDKFRVYTNALDRCKKLPVDSLLRCSRNIINIDTLKGIEYKVWQDYGKAKALFHNNLGFEAIDVIDNVLPKTENPDLLFERAELLQLRSILYNNSYRMQLAAEDRYQAAGIYVQLGLLREASSCYLGIANLQYNTANYSLTVENGLRALDLFKEILPHKHEDSVQMMHLYNTLALGYYKLNYPDSAEKYYDLSYDMANSLKDEFWMGLVTGNLADIYLSKGMVKKAIENYQYDIRTSFKYYEFASASLAMMSIGEIYVLNEQPDIGRLYYDSAYALLEKSGRPSSLSKYNKLMSQWYEIKDDYSKAFAHYKKYIEFRDSVQSIEINSQLQRIQNQKQFEKQLADINLLKTENELRKKELTISRISIIAFVLISTLLLILLYTIKRNYKKLNELNLDLESKVRARTARLRKINRELDTYLYRASHDVRRPILTILGLINVANLANESERFVIRKTIMKTAFEMDKMLKKLQMAYELEKEKKRNKVTFVINQYISDKVAELKKEFPCATFEIIEDGNITVRSNINLVDIICSNILENACTFSANGTVHVVIILSLQEDSMHVLVRDNGIGVDPGFINKIFDPYERFSNKSTGSGLGLYLAMKAAKKIDGHITVTSNPNEGSEFLVTFPAY